jgi:hypothetical protein
VLVEKQVLREPTGAVSAARIRRQILHSSVIAVLILIIVSFTYTIALVLFHMGSVLIDDREKLKNDWEKAGGTFVLHTSARSTLNALSQLGILPLQADEVGDGDSTKESAIGNHCSISNVEEE